MHQTLRLGALPIALAAHLGGCATPEAATDTVVIVTVRTAAVIRAPITGSATAQASVSARREATLSAPVTGQLSGLGNLQSTQVTAGQVIAILEARDVVQAQKDRRDAQSTLTRLDALSARRHALLDQGGISRKDVEETDLELATARSALSAATAALTAMGGDASADGPAKIRAPFAGVVTSQLQFDGEYVAEGTPLFKLVDLSGFVVKARFPDRVGAHIAQGAPATVEDESSRGETVTGTVTRVSPTTDPDSRTLEVWVAVTDGQGHLRAGDAAQVTTATRFEPDAVVVPSQAVQLDTSNGDEGVVMVVDDAGVAHATRVRTGIRAGELTQIVEGLTGGEQVVIDGNYALPDGTKVKVDAAPAEPAKAP